MYICDFFPSKRDLHPEMLPSLAYIIKLLKITIKAKTGLLMCLYFLLYVYLFYILTNWYYPFDYFSDLPFLFIMLVTTIWFLNFGISSFSKTFQLSS